ncbi:inositol monophosphatase family protein [Corynebacterium mendelii]|uniref:Inositol monophosphatase n=1 Tax=Corynebacterium mendelii TaxID=2765362 RepID=A0A939E187_9CORY|nr:inositol monophosphatase [Corynebacterium mendelii]MBN9643607.1 inositol monophosphatase [Corynebacterium mendelii]
MDGIGGQEQLDRALAAAADAVAGVAGLFMDGLGTALGRMKAGGGIVTEVDLAIERTLRTRLASATGWPVFGEETGGTVDTGPVWVVDPIDGTSNFAAGNPMCATLVSLLHRGQPVVAVVAAPALGHTWTAVAGGPVTDNSVPLGPPATTTTTITPTVGFGSIVSPDDAALSTGERQRILGELAADHPSLRVTGSVGLDLAFTAAGIFGAAVTFSPHVWDNAAGVLLARSAGLAVTDLLGRPWTPHAMGVVAGNPLLHSRITDRISSARFAR